MNMPGNLFLIIAGVATLIVAIGLFRSILDSSRLGQKYREKLFQRIKTLRLHKMLRLLGIDEQKYLYQSRVADIENQIDRCNGCDEKAVCDEHLEQGHVDDADRFCPNNEELKSLLRKT